MKQLHSISNVRLTDLQKALIVRYYKKRPMRIRYSRETGQYLVQQRMTDYWGYSLGWSTMERWEGRITNAQIPVLATQYRPGMVKVVEVNR